MATEKQLANLKRGNPDTQFKSGRSAIENGRKGGKATAIAKRKKYASRKYLKELLAIKPTLSPTDLKILDRAGVKDRDDIDNEFLVTMAMLVRAKAGDLRAIDMVHEYLAEDPHSVLEEKRLKVQKEAVSALKNSDGFMEAMGNVVEEVFDDGGDTPDALDDSE